MNEAERVKRLEATIIWAKGYIDAIILHVPVPEWAIMQRKMDAAYAEIIPLNISEVFYPAQKEKNK